MSQKTIQFSIDLVEAALKHRQFLHSSLMNIRACMLDHTFRMQSGGVSTPRLANNLNSKSNHCTFLSSEQVFFLLASTFCCDQTAIQS